MGIQGHKQWFDLRGIRFLEIALKTPFWISIISFEDEEEDENERRQLRGRASLR